MSEPSKRQFSPYFAVADLDRVRILETDRLPIPALPFRQAARHIGLEFLDPSPFDVESEVATWIEADRYNCP